MYVNPKKVDERKLLIFVGISTMALGRFLQLPIPGMGPPPLANEKHLDSAPDSFRMLQNVPCQETSSGQPGCALEWCTCVPRTTIFQFFAGLLIGSIGYPFGVAISMSLFSKIIGPRPQGIWMGLFTGFGSMARVLGPIFVGFFYANYGMYYTIGPMVVMVILTLILTIMSYKRLVPLQIGNEVLEGHQFETHM